jgi:carbonic anhydrase
MSPINRLVSFAMATFICCAALNAATCPPSCQEALDCLMDGNNHFVEGKVTHLSYIVEAKDKMLEKQTPFAAIVGCSDSRVPPELIFDRGLGELFVIRDAGNVIGPIEMDSVEFAVSKLKVPLVLVMGHQNCGAIQATLVGKENVPELDNIYPLIEAAFNSCGGIKKNTPLKEAVCCNVKKSVETLKKSPTIAPILAANKVKIVGAYFDFESGKVSLLPD